MIALAPLLVRPEAIFLIKVKFVIFPGNEALDLVRCFSFYHDFTVRHYSQKIYNTESLDWLSLAPSCFSLELL